MDLGPRTIMFQAFLFIMGTLCSMMCDVWISDISALETLTGYRVTELSGVGGMVTGAIGFFTTGFPAMLTWDYAFLESDISALNDMLMILRIILVITVSSGFVYGMWKATLPLAQGVFGGLTRIFGF